MNKMLAYSAIKSKAKRPPPNSILNPETSSDSPSAKSNGARLVSATVLVNQTTIIGKSSKQTGKLLITALSQEKEIRIKAENKRIKSNLTSYEIVWAAARRAPKKAYLELEDQPAIKVP